MVKRLCQTGVLLAVIFGCGALPAQAGASPWTVVASPNVGPGDNELDAVAAIGANNVWAVGLSDPNALIEHWNGTAWTTVASHVTGGGFLEWIDAVSATDIWADGYGSGTPLVEHYNGTSWAPIAPPPGAEAIDGISATSPTDVWVEAMRGTPDGHEKAYLERWNGTRWAAHHYDSVGADRAIGLGPVVAFGPSNVWLLGSDIYADGSSLGYTEQFTGPGGFIDHGGPNAPDNADNELIGIGASSATDIWDVGSWDNEDVAPSPVFGPLAGYWNGHAWVTPALPTAYSACCHVFNAVAPVTTSNVWAVGYRDSTTGTDNLLEHWNGSSWTEWGGPNPTTFNELLGVAHVPGTGMFWTVGFTDQDPERTLIMRCC